MRYFIEEYDKQGFLKPPSWLWLGWFFLSKAWVVFIVSGASRDDGSKLLEIIYPVHSTFYTGLAMGSPVLIFMWLMGLRNTERKWICKIASGGRWITIVFTVLQLGLLGYQIVLERGEFSWPHAISLVILSWFLIYVINSRRVKDCFVSPV